MSSSKILLLVVFVVLSTKTEFSSSQTCTPTCFPVLNAIYNVQVTPADVQFYLRTADNQTILLNSTGTISLINTTLPTKIIVHGWETNSLDPWVLNTAYNYHQTIACNVILVDWSSLADGDYTTAALACQCVGIILGDFIISLIQQISLNRQTVHLIGHSFGGHIVGFAGKQVQSSGGGNLDRISPLDAANVPFQTPVLQNANCRVAKTDANFVDLMHVSIVGVTVSLGTVDVYVNGQLTQPGCSVNAACSHNIAPIYWYTSILYPYRYPALSCDNYLSYVAGSCNSNPVVYMGNSISRNASGNYYATINAV